MRLYRNFLFFVFIYLISDNKWILVKFTESTGCISGETSCTLDRIKGWLFSKCRRRRGSSGISSTSTSGVDLDITSDTQSTDEFDYNKVGQYVTYTPKGNNAFKLVKDGNTEVWKETNSTNYSCGVQVELSGDRKAVIIHLPGDKTKVFTKDYTNEPWSEIYEDKINPRPVNIMYDKEIYFHSNNLDGSKRTFESADGFAFNCAYEYVNNNKIEIWKTDQESEYSNKIVNEEGNKVIIYMADYVTAKVFTKGTDGTWAQDTEASTEVTKIYSELGSILSPPKTSTPKTGVDLNIRSDTQSTDEFDCKKVGQYVTYTPKGNIAFKLVKDNGTNIWETTDNTSYSSRVEVDLLDNESKAVTVYLCDYKTKVFKKDGKRKPWNEIDTTKANPKSINIDYPDESYLYKNELNNNVRTFTAKPGFTFNVVNEYIDDKMVEIWKTDKENEYANKIEVDRINDDARAFTVYMAGNKTRVFKKDGKNSPWKEFDTTQVNPKSINICFPYESYFYMNALKNDIRTFVAKDGFVFNIVYQFIDENNRVIIWKTDNQDEYAKKIVLEGDNKVTIYIGHYGSAKVFNKEADGTWIDTAAPTPKTSGKSCTWDTIKGWLSCKCCGSSCGSSSGSSETGAGTSGCSSCGCGKCGSCGSSGSHVAGPEDDASSSSVYGEGSGTNLSTRGTASSNMF